MTVPDWSEWVIRIVPDGEIVPGKRTIVGPGMFVVVNDGHEKGPAKMWIPFSSDLNLDLNLPENPHDHKELRTLALEAYADLTAVEVV